MNISTGLVELSAGANNYAMDFAKEKSYAFGIEYFSWNYFTGDAEYQVDYAGLRFIHFLNGEPFKPGPYLKIVAYRINVEISNRKAGERYQGDTTDLAYGIGGGKLWAWDSFNIMLGLDFVKSNLEDTVTLKASSGLEDEISVQTSKLDIGFSVYFAIGYFI